MDILGWIKYDILRSCVSIFLKVTIRIFKLFMWSCVVKAMVFPVVMYGCESWIIKKAEHKRVNAFEL